LRTRLLKLVRAGEPAQHKGNSMKLTHKQNLMVAVVLSIVGISPVAHAQNDGAVWIEAENTASSNLKSRSRRLGQHAVLVGGQVGNVNIDAG
jgi:hypothetical protein